MNTSSHPWSLYIYIFKWVLMIRSHRITRILLTHHLRLSLAPSKNSIVKLSHFSNELRIAKRVIMHGILPLVPLRCKHSLLLYLYLIAIFISDLSMIIVHLVIVINLLSLLWFGLNPCLVVLHLWPLIIYCSAYFALVRAIVLVLTVWIHGDLVCLVGVV